MELCEEAMGFWNWLNQQLEFSHASVSVFQVEDLSFICVYSGYQNVFTVSGLPVTYSYIITQELKLQKKWSLLGNSSKFEDPG